MTMTRNISILIALATLTACGGAFEKGDGGQAGSAGTAGSGSSSGSGSGSGGGPAGHCHSGANTYANGESFSDGCNTCFCDNGEMSCSSLYCGDLECTYDKLIYQIGESFPAVDGCNTCTCEDDGAVSCTDLACATCDGASEASAAWVEEARACDPEQPNQCTQLVAGALDCGCPTYVNPENDVAIAALTDAHEQYSELMCGPSPCDCASPSGAYCSPAGRCMDLWDGALTACQVNGEVYPSGSSGFAGPLGCHTCACYDGELSCTEEECPSGCPPDSVDGSQCAQCGPTDACEVVEYTCLKVCSDTCDVGVCLDGVCRNVCG